MKFDTAPDIHAALDMLSGVHESFQPAYFSTLWASLAACAAIVVLALRA